MESYIAGLVSRFVAGKVDRRQFCETMAVVATVCASSAAAQAQPARGFKVLGVNHLSYACPDYRVARDWYAKVFGTGIYNDKGMGRANLAFGGPGPGVGSSFMVSRNATGEDKPTTAAVDYVSYTVQNWDDTRINRALKAQGLPPTAGKGSATILDPFGYPVQIASSNAQNPFI